MAYVKFPIQESFLDYPDPAIRCLTIFFIGCRFNCPSCHNKELQEIDASDQFISYAQLRDELVTASKRYRTKHIALMGGEPLHDYNLETTRQLVNSGEWHSIIYTGYTMEKARERLGISNFDFLKCGLYKEEMHQDSGKDMHQFKLASTNQILYKTGYIPVSSNGIYSFNKE